MLAVPYVKRPTCYCVTKARFCRAQKSGAICTRLRSSRSIAAEFKRRKKDSNSVSLLQNSSNAANFDCVRGAERAGAQAGAGLSCVTRSI